MPWARSVRAGSLAALAALLLPPDATLMKDTVKGGQRMVDESNAWADRLRETFRSALADRGLGIAGDYSQDDVTSDETLRQTIVLLKEKYSNVLPQMRKKSNDVKRGRFSLGDEVTLLPCAAQADIVVFIRGGGILLTGGSKVLGIIAGGPATLVREGSMVWFSLVDAKSGEVLAFSHLRSVGSSFLDRPA